MSENIPFEQNNFRGRLRCLKGIYAGAVIDMDAGECIIIGSSPLASNLVLETVHISKKHCSIRYDEEKDCYFVRDLSANGTYLGDGTRLVKNRETKLKRGSIIYIASVDNMFVLD